MGRKKVKGQSGSDNGQVSTSSTEISPSRHVQFNADSTEPKIHSNGTSIHRSPSTSTLNRLEREHFVLWKRPLHTIYFCILELGCIVRDFAKSLLHPARLVPLLLLLAAAACSYYIEGPHKMWAKRLEKPILWSLYWMWLGVLSSVGFGSGLHTFVLYLGPHIASVTLAAYECGSLNFPEPPYPDEIKCPTDGSGKVMVTLWAIVSKVRLESLMWGVGTALGELPPYFMARAARISGEEPDDEEYQEYCAFIKDKGQIEQVKSPFVKAKIWLETKMDTVIRNVGFLAILAFASIPNPLFDIAGMTCGHFLIPFWTFFGATLIGKAVIKMHFQMLCVVVAFSEHHVENLINKLKTIPYVGGIIQKPLKDLLVAQKTKLHRKTGDSSSIQTKSLLESLMNWLVTLMIIVFLCSLINSLAQRYHKRRSDALKTTKTS